jgi:hypothetical protein
VPGQSCLVKLAEAEAPAAWTARWVFHAPSCRPKGVFYAKRVFELGETPRRALFHVAADSRYALFCNGELVGRGPVRATHRRVFFDTYDLSRLLQPGGNVLAAAVHVMGRPFFVYVSGTPGLMVQADADIGDATPGLSTGPGWLVQPAAAYDQAATLFTFQAGWTELYDARREDPDWAEAWAKGWLEPDSVSVEEALRGRALWPRMIPALLDEAHRPRRIAQARVVPPCEDAALKADYARLMHEEPHHDVITGTVEGREAFLDGSGPLTLYPPGNGQGVLALLDFGQTLAGFASFEVEGPAGAVLDIGWNEALVDDRLPAARGELDGREYRFADRYILGGGRREHSHLFAYRAGRFAQLVARDFEEPVRIHRFQHHLTTYPVSPRGRFSCGDLDLSRLYEAGRRTLQLCMWDTYMDCPWREQAMWVGDMFAEALYEHLAFGDPRMTRQCLEMAADSLTERGLLRAVYPSEEAGVVIPSFSLLFVLTAENYVRYTGDAGVIEAVWPVVPRVLDTFESFRGESGLLDEPQGFWHFYDWGYRRDEGQCGLLALLYAGGLQAAARLARRRGLEAEALDFDRRAARTAEAVNRLLWDGSARAYRDRFRPGSGPCGPISQHTNALALFFGVTPPDRQAATLDALEREEGVVLAEPFYQFFVLTALARHGRLAQALAVLRRRFAPMLDSQTGTIWEYWRGKAGPGGGWGNGSLCHAFSCPMLYLLPTFVLGVEPVEDGFRQFRCAPQTGGLAFAQGRVPTPFGGVQVSWVDSADRLALSIETPLGDYAFELALPFTGRDVSIRDAQRRDHPYVPGAPLPPGKYTIVVKK